MNLAIDIGNTRGKAAVFENNTLLEVFIFDKNHIISLLKKIIKKFPISQAIISNVASISEIKLQKLQKLVNLQTVSYLTNVPFLNLYKTPSTLGVDRIALVSAAATQFSNKNVLVIDAGTCITFDFINDRKEYLGGSISLGIKMRYQALHNFTANLPLLEIENLEDFIGKNTKESINSGVINGVLKEIDGIILDYKVKYSDLTVVLTGGDTNFLSKQLKSSIFANQNFLLQGLNEILIFNKHK